MDILKIPMSEDQKQQLAKIIDQTKKYKNGYLFAEPVDYMALGILDYPKVIRNPMDFQTLRRNLMTHKYIFLTDFLKDAELIFENCRIYNGNSNEGFYKRAADESEKFFVGLVCKMKEYNLNYAGYKKLIGKGDDENAQQDIKNEEDGKEQLDFTIQNIQQLVKKLQEVPDFFMMEYIKEYAQSIGDNTDMDVPEFKLSFDLKHQEQLKQLDKRVSDKLAEIKAKKNRRPNKQVTNQ